MYFPLNFFFNPWIFIGTKDSDKILQTQLSSQEFEFMTRFRAWPTKASQLQRKCRKIKKGQHLATWWKRPSTYLYLITASNLFGCYQAETADQTFQSCIKRLFSSAIFAILNPIIMIAKQRLHTFLQMLIMAVVYITSCSFSALCFIIAR